MKISIVIPAYNEEEKIGKTLEEILKYLKNRDYSYELIVIDDGSIDNTLSIVKGFIRKNKNIRLLRNSKNKGKGYSVKKGIMSAKYPFILFSDSDLSTPILELDKMINEIKSYDIVIASRNLKKSDIAVRQPLFRTLPGKAFSLLVNLITLLGIKDTQCGFKLFKKSIAREVFPKQTINRWGFDVEILYIAKKLGYKIKEVPVTWVNSEASKLNVLKDPFFMFIELLKIRLNNFLGKYG